MLVRTGHRDAAWGHLAGAADPFEHAQEDEDPSSQEAEGQGPAHRAWVVKALAVYDAQHALAMENRALIIPLAYQMCNMGETGGDTRTSRKSPSGSGLVRNRFLLSCCHRDQR